MNAMANKMMKTYSQTHVDANVTSATPHELISMLYDGALVAITKARIAMLNGEIASKCEAISNAVSIIGFGLQVSLDVKSGGELGENLNALYDYMIHRLVAANLHNQTELLDEVSHLLSELKGAWNAMDKNKVRIVQSVPNNDALPQRSVSVSYGAA